MGLPLLLRFYTEKRNHKQNFIKIKIQPITVVNTFNPNTQKTEAGGLQV